MILGRLGGTWAVPWDPHVSHRHAQLFWNGSRLEVTRLPNSRNPIFLLGKEADRFSIQPGDHFVIGQTSFTLADQRVNITADAPQPVQQQSFSAQYLRQVQFRNPDYRIEVLSRLPDVISGAAGDAELVVRLVSMLLAGVPRATPRPWLQWTVGSAAVDSGRKTETFSPGACSGSSPSGNVEAQMPTDEINDYVNDESQMRNDSDQDRPPVRILHWDQRLVIGSDFQPSQGLILESLRQRQSVLHVWRGAETSSPDSFTESENYDWAFCTPVVGKASSGWALYMAGRFNVEHMGVPRSSDPTDLREDVKFTELVAAMLSSLRQMRLVGTPPCHAQPVFFARGAGNAGRRRPRGRACAQGNRGLRAVLRLAGVFARVGTPCRPSAGPVAAGKQGPGRDDPLYPRTRRSRGRLPGRRRHGLLGLALATKRRRLAHLPRRLGHPRRVRGHGRVPCRHRRGHGQGRGRKNRHHRSGESHRLRSGREPGLAPGKHDQNTPRPILLDEATASAVRRQVPRDVARVRRLAVVKPYGMDSSLEVSELLPPLAQYPVLTDEHLAYYEMALDKFLSRNWAAAFELLHRIPAEDEVKDFLTVYIAEHNRRVPLNWDGVIPLESK